MEYLRDEQNLIVEEAPKEISDEGKADSEIEEQIRSSDSAVKLDTPEAWCDHHQSGETNEINNSTLDWLKFTGRNFLTVCIYQLNSIDFIFRDEGFASPCCAVCDTLHCHRRKAFLCLKIRLDMFI